MQVLLGHNMCWDVFKEDIWMEDNPVEDVEAAE
jgi:hypothetical protein